MCKPCSRVWSVESVCISTVDTDIFVYALFFSSKISTSIFIQLGVGDRRRVIDIGNIVSELGVDLRLALPALHSFTGNDYTSAFHGMGKRKHLPSFVNLMNLFKHSKPSEKMMHSTSLSSQSLKNLSANFMV